MSFCVAGLTGFEPATSRVTGERSEPLSYNPTYRKQRAKGTIAQRSSITLRQTGAGTAELPARTYRRSVRAGNPTPALSCEGSQMPNPTCQKLLQVQERIPLDAVHADFKMDVNAGLSVDAAGIPHPGDHLAARDALSLLYI